MAARFLPAVLAVAIPLVGVAAPVPRTPLKNDPRVVRSIDDHVVLVTDRDESVPDFFARMARDGVRTYQISANRASLDDSTGGRRTGFAARLTRPDSGTTTQDRRVGSTMTGWQSPQLIAPDARFAALLGRELAADRAAGDDFVLLVRELDTFVFEVVGYARTAKAVDTLNAEYRPTDPLTTNRRFQWANQFPGGC